MSLISILEWNEKNLCNFSQFQLSLQITDISSCKVLHIKSFQCSTTHQCCIWNLRTVRVFIFNRFFLQQWIQTPACREFLRRKGVLKPSQSVTGGEVIQEVPQIGWRRCMRLLCARWVQDIVWIWSQTRIFILEARLWICDHGVQISVLLNNPRLSLHN